MRALGTKIAYLNFISLLGFDVYKAEILNLEETGRIDYTDFVEISNFLRLGVKFTKFHYTLA